MELKDFIKTAVSDITSAICELNSELNNGTVVNPIYKNPPRDLELKEINGAYHSLRNINFDIAIAAMHSNKKEAGAGFALRVVTASIGKGNDDRIESSSRISFSLPLLFPGVLVDNDVPIPETSGIM